MSYQKFPKATSISDSVKVEDFSNVAYFPSDIPYWTEIKREEAQLLPESATLMVQYVEYWTVPSGADGVDVGYIVRDAGAVKSNRTWDVRAAPLTRAIFGGGRGRYHFYIPYTSPAE